MKKTQIGLQTWTIRDYIDKDFRKAYETMARIGFGGVEIGSPDPLTPAEYKQMLDDLGMKCIGIHISRDEMANDLLRMIDRNLTLDCKYLVLAYLQECERGEEGYRKTSDILGKAAEIAAQHGITVAHHNHDFEFEEFDGKHGYDILAEGALSGKFGLELDVYWATKGNQDPVNYINKLAGRIPLLHMKDMESGPERTFAPVGAGVIDMPAIVSAGDKAGVQWYIVEQDICKGDQLECATLSYKNLSKLCDA